MKRRQAMWVAASVAGLLSSLATAAATSPDRQLVKLQGGEETTVFGTPYRAVAPTLAIVSVSSELVTAAVITGELVQGKATARAGQALVTPIDGKATQQFGFDAARLAATLSPDFLVDTQTPLQTLAAGQRRAKFWGLIEPAGINASAPVGGAVEAVRQSYLGNNTIVTLRRAAGGKLHVLAGLTANRFAEALTAGDARVVSDLIDPKPFIDTGADANAWQAARRIFAQKLTSDAALKAAMSATPAAAEGKPDAFVAGGVFRIQLVARDRAMFVAAVEPLS